MTRLDDIALARLWNRELALAPGAIAAPAALGEWTGHALTLSPTGRPLAPAAARLAPDLADALTSGGLALPPDFDTPARLATHPEQVLAELKERHLPHVTPETLRRRLATCQACPLWTPPAAPALHGRCESVAASCSRRIHWHPLETCPANLWP